MNTAALFALASCARENEKYANALASVLTNPALMAAAGGLASVPFTAMSQPEEDLVVGPDGRPKRVSKGRNWLRNAIMGAVAGGGAGLGMNWLSGKAQDLSARSVLSESPVNKEIKGNTEVLPKIMGGLKDKETGEAYDFDRNDRSGGSANNVAGTIQPQLNRSPKDALRDANKWVPGAISWKDL